MANTLISIPGYHLNEQLYDSSRTLVYRGYRETDSLRVVVKLLKNPHPSFSELVQFRNQYIIAKNLNSPLIIQTYNLEPYQNGYALVMEDFGGISLKDYFASVDTRYTVFLQKFLQIAIALCNALEILYRDRIIHKDIKPSNILINPETKQVKLIDFSIASLLPRETQTLINPNVLEGTLAYISPEQTGRINRGIDYRTDFYSLGVTFYELLTGELPFQSHDSMELVHCHIAKTAPLVHKVNPQIPSVLSDVVSKLMAKNAEDRYQSALGIKFDLENCLNQLQETSNVASFENALDFAAILKSSQIIAGTIQLDELLKKLTKIILQNSGANRCVLLMPNNNEQWQIRVIATSENVQLYSEEIEKSDQIPVKLIQYVKNILEVVIIDDSKTNLLINDDYFHQHQPQSMLCLPMLNQGQLVSILYLENRSTSRVFTSDHLLIINFICTQAAISLENARLYQESQTYAQKLEISLAELQATKARFQKFADNLPGMIYQYQIAADGTMSVVYVSSGCIDLYEVSAQDFMNGKKNFGSMEHPDDRPSIHKEVQHSIQTLTPFQHEWRIITTSGVVKWVKAVSQPEMQPDGSIILNGVLMDVTDQHQTQIQLQESQQLLQLVLNTIPQFVFWKDFNSIYLGCNQLFAEIAGLDSTEQIKGKIDYDLAWKKEEADFFRECDRRIMDSKIPEIGIIEPQLQADGKQAWLETNKAPLLDASGNVIGILGTFQDITVRKQAEELIRQSEAALKQKSQELEQTLQNLQQAQLQVVQSEKMSALGNLVAGVAHEMNNPLGFIYASLQQAKPIIADIFKHLELYRKTLPNPDDEIKDHAIKIDLDSSLEDLPKMIDAMVMACDRLKNIQY